MYDKNTVLNFYYDGENREGLVLDCGSTNVRLWDFDREDFRCFTLKKMQNVSVLTNVKFVDLNNLPKDFDYADMWRQFCEEGRDVYKVCDRLVAVWHEPVHIKYVYNRNSKKLIAHVHETADRCEIRYVDGTVINCPTNKDWLNLLDASN